MASRQGDFFQDDNPDLFGEDAPTPEYRADPIEVRNELNRILSEVRAADKLPWDARKTLVYRTTFPQMALWLPEDESAQLCLEFEKELERLRAA